MLALFGGQLASFVGIPRYLLQHLQHYGPEPPGHLPTGLVSGDVQQRNLQLSLVSPASSCGFKTEQYGKGSMDRLRVLSGHFASTSEPQGTDTDLGLELRFSLKESEVVSRWQTYKPLCQQAMSDVRTPGSTLDMKASPRQRAWLLFLQQHMTSLLLMSC